MTINLIRKEGGVNITRQGGGVMILRDARGPAGPQNVTFGMYISGGPLPDEMLIRGQLPQSMVVSLAISAASCEVAPSVRDQVLTMTLNGTPVGTVTFAVGESDAVIAFGQTIWPAGVFRLIAPNLLDPSFSGISVSIGGART